MPLPSREYLKTDKTSLSNWLLGIFLLTLAISAALSEFFQTPDWKSGELSRYRNLFREGELETKSTMEITNELGTFRLSKNIEKAPHDWKLTHPRQLTADPRVADKIFSAIKNMKILKVHPKDPINMANYSLDTPPISVHLEDLQGKKIVLKIGLTNSIDNSTYVTLPDRDAIFHVEKLEFPLRSLNLSELIDTTVFSMPTSEIAELKIHKGPHKNLTFSARKRGTIWLGRNNRPLNEDKMNRYLGELHKVRSLFILDEMSDKLRKEIHKYRSSPLFTVLMRDDRGNTYTYKLSNILPKLSDVNMEKGMNFLITTSHGKHPHLVGKNHLKLFSINESKLNRLDFKKLFY